MDTHVNLAFAQQFPAFGPRRQSGDSNSPVEHVGLVADGTRRWAEKHGAALPEAYFASVEKIEPLSDAVFENGTDAFSIYLLSVNNLRRDPVSLRMVFDAETYMLDRLLPRIAARWECRMVHAGDAALLPASYALSLERLCTSTSHFQCRTMYLCAAYDPISEISHAYDLSRTNGRPVATNLWVPRALDLVVRTGGEYRISNFLPLQSGYAELYFTDKLFPDFTCDDLSIAYQSFFHRQRRHGL